jgi:hypothetical protein
MMGCSSCLPVSPNCFFTGVPAFACGARNEGMKMARQPARVALAGKAPLIHLTAQ